MAQIPFPHQQSAHCETGVLSNLLTYHGLKLSEALAFGVGSGLFFGYFPFIRLNHLPLTAFRIKTGGIMKRCTKRLGVGMTWKKFHSPQEAMDDLDRKMDRGIPVGCRTGAYWLDYFPKRYRFHFNMHHIIVFGRKAGSYIISDPVFPEPVLCSRESLMKARFAKGPMQPKGNTFMISHTPVEVDLAGAVLAGIKEVCRTMLKAPGPFIGIKGIRFAAGRMESWPERLGERKAALHIGQFIRMQEEIGTGGAGFRFLFAAFLQECADILSKPHLLQLSEQMTAIGDKWREVALVGSRICKKRASSSETYHSAADLLRHCAAGEERLFRNLREAVH